jgi:hypothetical protein
MRTQKDIHVVQCREKSRLEWTEKESRVDGESENHLRIPAVWDDGSKRCVENVVVHWEVLHGDYFAFDVIESGVVVDVSDFIHKFV